MTPNEYNEFHDAWVNAHAMSSSNQVPSNAVVSAVFDVLIEYPLQHVLGALQVHSRQSRFAPTPSDLVEIINGRTGQKHIAADEAWAIVIESMDESATVVMTQEMMDARLAVWPIWESGDSIGARMAFREAYGRVIQSAEAPRWQVIAGWDANRRLSAIEKAKSLGRLPAGYTLNHHLLPAPEAETTVAGLLESAEKKISESEADIKKARLGISMLRRAIEGYSDNDIEKREEIRKSFEKHRQQELSKLAQKAGELH